MKGHILFCLRKKHPISIKKFSETNIVFAIDNIFIMFIGHVFQQTVGIPMGTNCAHLLAELFLYSLEADFIQGSLKIISRPAI
jgi:hypothetical protein